MTSAASMFQVVDAPESTSGVSAPSAAEAASAGSFGAFLSALVNATDEISNFYSNYMIAQAKITGDESDASIGTSKAQVTATNNEISKMKKYEDKLKHASALNKLIKDLSIAVSVLVVCVISVTTAGTGTAGSIALALAVFSLISSALPSEDNPLTMAGNQLGKAFGDRSAGQWIGLGLQIAIGLASMGLGGVISATGSAVTATAETVATEGVEAAVTQVTTKLAQSIPNILKMAKNIALLLEIGTTATSMTAATYTLEAANIMQNKIAPLQGDISLLTAFAELIQTQQTQQSESQTAMDSSFSELFTAQDQLATAYGSAYQASV